MNFLISQNRIGISAICERYRIHRLEVFGSVARAVDFTSTSDADFLVEFASDARLVWLNSSAPRPSWSNCSAVAWIWSNLRQYATRTCWLASTEIGS